MGSRKKGRDYLIVRHIPQLKKDIEELIQEELEKGNLDLDIN